MWDTKLIETFSQEFNILTNKEISDFVLNAKSKIIKKGDFFIRQDEACREVVFIS